VEVNCQLHCPAALAPGQSPWHPTQSRCELSWKQKNLLPLSGIEPWFLVVIKTVLSQLLSLVQTYVRIILVPRVNISNISSRVPLTLCMSGASSQNFICLLLSFKREVCWHPQSWFITTRITVGSILFLLFRSGGLEYNRRRIGLYIHKNGRAYLKQTPVIQGYAHVLKRLC
jgi:hypothetical protein